MKAHALRGRVAGAPREAVRNDSLYERRDSERWKLRSECGAWADVEGDAPALFVSGPARLRVPGGFSGDFAIFPGEDTALLGSTLVSTGVLNPFAYPMYRPSDRRSEECIAFSACATRFSVPGQLGLRTLV